MCYNAIIMPHSYFPNSMIISVTTLINTNWKIVSDLLRTCTLNSIRSVDLKEQLLGWSTPLSADENDDEREESRVIVTGESITDETVQCVPKRLADLRVHLANKQYALSAAKEAATFDQEVRFVDLL
jgi:hypothetical protein